MKSPIYVQRDEFDKDMVGWAVKAGKDQLVIVQSGDETDMVIGGSMCVEEEGDERMSHPSNKVTEDNVFDVVRYHPPIDEQVKKHEALAHAAETFIRSILVHAPDCADRSTAIRAVREAKMWASAAVALDLKP